MRLGAVAAVGLEGTLRHGAELLIWIARGGDVDDSMKFTAQTA
jgi:hypothetical protein